MPTVSYRLPEALPSPAWRLAPCDDPTEDEAGATCVRPLLPAWQAVLQAAAALGPLEARAGDGVCSLVLRGTLPALQVDAGRWRCGMATQSPRADGGLRRGLVFFDEAGRPALRLVLAAGASAAGFEALVRRFGAEPGGTQPLRPKRAPGHAELLQALAGDRLAEPLAAETVLDVLRHATQAGLALRVAFHGRGLRLCWQGQLHHLLGRHGVGIACGRGLELHWRETRPGPQVWLLREPAPTGLAQSLLMLAPDGELRLVVEPAPQCRPTQPCAWRWALDAALGGGCGSAC